MWLEREAYHRAEEYFQKSLALKRRWAENDIPFEYAETFKNLSWVRLSQGHFQEAVSLVAYATGLAESAEDMGPESAATQTFRFAQSWVLFNAGQVDRALSLMLQTLQARSKLFGKSDPHTLDCYYGVGTMYHHKGMLLLEAELVSSPAVTSARLILSRDKIQESLQRLSASSWSEECIARTKFRLSLIVRQRHGTRNEGEGHPSPRSVLERWGLDCGVDCSKTSLIGAYDYVVPLGSGRFVGKEIVDA